MCSNPETISAGVPRLTRAFSVPVGAYPNLGYNPTGPIVNGPMLTNQRPSLGPDILQNAEFYPSRMAEFALSWKRMGDQILGGCCASGPEHISAMRPVIIRQTNEKGTVTFLSRSTTTDFSWLGPVSSSQRDSQQRRPEWFPLSHRYVM